MQLNGVASAVLVVWFVLSSLALIGLLAAITVALLKLNEKLTEVTDKVEPLLGRTDALVTLADEKLRSVGEKAETLLSTGGEIATTVQARVEQTGGTVQRTVNAPLIEANAVVSGLTRAWETLTKRRDEKKTPVTTREAVTAAAEEVAAVAAAAEPQEKQGVKVYGG